MCGCTRAQIFFFQKRSYVQYNCARVCTPQPSPSSALLFLAGINLICVSQNLTIISPVTKKYIFPGHFIPKHYPQDGHDGQADPSPEMLWLTRPAYKDGKDGPELFVVLTPNPIHFNLSLFFNGVGLVEGYNLFFLFKPSF